MSIIEVIKSLNYDEDLLYDYIIDQAKNLKELDNSDIIDENKIHGCMSQVYITVNRTSNGTTLKGYSDSQIISGILGILSQFIEKDPNPKYDFYKKDLEEIKLLLSQNRRLGFDNIIKLVFK